MFKSLVSIHNSQNMLIKTDTVASFTNNLFKKKKKLLSKSHSISSFLTAIAVFSVTELKKNDIKL